MRTLLAAAVLLPATALAGTPMLDISGPCPGDVAVTASGFTPGGSVAVVTGDSAGSDRVPTGPCEGYATGLSGLSYLTSVRADGRGGVSLRPTVGRGLCGTNVQFIDVSTCSMSNVDVVGGVDRPECSDYMTLDEDWRNVGATGAVYCDRDEVALNAWYRFEGPAGTMMPEWAPDAYQCSTHAPGWLDGAHPGPGDSGEIHTCWHWSGDTCLWESETTVTNCGGYYVYYLRDLPFSCNGVFCAE